MRAALLAAVAAAIAVAGSSGAASPAAPSVHASGGSLKPHIVHRPIPFGKKRKREMARYSKRHYGFTSYALKAPQAIVEHYTDNQSFSATYNTFAPDHADPELHELPNVCSHFVVDRDGTIYQLVSVRYMCRHTVGLNYIAIGIEHVGTSDGQILHDHRQLLASLRLTRWLRCRYGIRVRDVIGHNESVSSPYHYERVKSLRHQTHGDWTHHDMKKYRRKLAALHGC